MDDDLALSGLPRPAVVERDSADDADDFEVWEDGWESLIWFLNMSRRWVFNPMDGRRIRMDDQAVIAQLGLSGLKKSRQRQIMDDLLEMESAALEVLNARED